MLNHFYLYYIFIGIYINFGLFNSDLSVIYAFVIIVVSFYSRYQIFNKVINFIVIFLFVILALLLNASLEVVKTFIALFLGSHIYWELKRNKHLINNKILLGVSAIYFLAGIASLIEPSILKILFYRVGVDSTRGATGLAPEPSYLGLTCAFFYAYSSTVKSNVTIRFLFISTALLSMSIYSYLVLGLLVFIYESKYKISLFMLLVVISLLQLDNEFRIIFLLKKLYENGFEFILQDYSIMYRFLSIADFINGIFSFNGISGQGLNAGFTRIIIDFGVFGVVIFFTIILMSPYSRALILKSKNIFSLVLLVVMYFIGPISLPAFYFWLSSYES